MEEGEENLYVTVARLLRPRGNRGELIAEDLSGRNFGAQPAVGREASDAAEHFFKSGPVFLRHSSKQHRESAVERAWLHQGRLVLKLKDVDSISDAEVLRNVDLQIPRERLGPASDGEYYFEDLVGCEVRDADDGRLIGSVDDVLDPGGGIVVAAGRAGTRSVDPFR